jgi:hypothetical protein
VTAADPFTEHPAPHRRRVNIGLLLAGLGAGPFAWIIQLVASYGIASYACFPPLGPRLNGLPAGWSGEAPGLIALNLACLAIASLGLATSFLHWRRTRSEKAGVGEHVLETGEGRTRFLAAAGMMACTGFGLAILFNALEPLMIAGCWRMAG